MRGMRFALPFVLLFLAAGSASAGRVDNPTLTGDVGLGGGFTISLRGPDGLPIKNVDPGTYTLVARDHSDIHNFHLFGPGGVDVSTDIGNVENKTFTITLVAGKYSFICDAHPSMKGTFTVGGAVAPPPPTTTVRTKLNASVGPGVTISLRAADGKALSSHSHGAFTIVVNDKSAKDNFHLAGPGLSKKTGIAFKGTVTWKLTLKAGNYIYGSDGHVSLRRAFKLR